ncbi:hypothetical protein LSTR_LSTR000869 [Laodelphax striatellus]|uniref:Uncharacterized protein n=1 Tax=Laodelphax striatellus TaxID=195883 RepID=A0A482X0R4_LAOST|nr:hypothetical protein LSTR_LSTR000869 [Laodelphax striatellus]
MWGFEHNMMTGFLAETVARRVNLVLWCTGERMQPTLATMKCGLNVVGMVRRLSMTSYVTFYTRSSAHITYGPVKLDWILTKMASLLASDTMRK